MATLTQEEFNRLVQEVTDEIQNKSNDPGQFELAESLAGITSLPVLWQSGGVWQLKRALISLLKGADGRGLEFGKTDLGFQWRYTDGEWINLMTFDELLQPATGLMSTLQTIIDLWNNTTKEEILRAITNANASVDKANETNEVALAAIERVEEIEGVLVKDYKLIPQQMTLYYPKTVTFGRDSNGKINYTLYPADMGRNVLFLSDNNAVSVLPDGSFLVLRPGISIIHVIPTENTSIYKTIQITVVALGLRKLKTNSLRFTGNGNLRFN